MGSDVFGCSRICDLGLSVLFVVLSKLFARKQLQGCDEHTVFIQSNINGQAQQTIIDNCKSNHKTPKKALHPKTP